MPGRVNRATTNKRRAQAIAMFKYVDLSPNLMNKGGMVKLMGMAIIPNEI